MSDRQTMISYEEALAIVLKTAGGRRMQTESISVGACAGRVCAQGLKAPLSMQPFDNSAMDGFAVVCSDLAGASEDKPVTLRKAGMIAAGDPVTENPVEPGSCLQIMTGAPVPPKADAVVPVELVKVEGENICFTAQPKEHANIRMAGEDFTKGDELLQPGQRLSPAHVLPLATLGIDAVEVYKKPCAAFLATGKELVDDLSQDLKSGQIYNSNRPYALAALEKMGVVCVNSQTIHDDPAIFDRVLKEYMDQNLDLIISSGAVSAGEFDFVRSGLEKAGAEILFHKVKIKPGKPNLFARLPNGTLYFGLPGNPVASAAGLRFFVDPALRTMTERNPESPVQAKVMNGFSKHSHLRMFLKARAEIWEDGLLTVDLLDGQASFMVSPFLEMNCWAVAPEGKEEIKAGDMIDLYPLFPHEGLI